jgi:TPR repeat protein
MAGKSEPDLIQVAMEEWEAGNLSRAEALLLQAAEAGSGHAAHNLGALYATGGPGIEPDPGKSQYWYEKAFGCGFEETVASNPTWFQT